MKRAPHSKLGRLGGLLVPLLLVFGGCSDDSAKDARPTRPSFGSELFGVLCDRVGAQALHEDLTGGSFEGICNGTSDKVDASRLPPAADPKVRQLATAKIEALGRHRAELIAAFETVFPEDTLVGKNLSSVDPKESCDPVSAEPRRDQLRGLLTRLLPTETNTVPESSRALADSIEPLTEAQSQAAREAIAHLAARRGYMPPDQATGLLGALLTAPRLRDTLAATMHLVSPDSTPYDKPNTVGVGHDTLGKLYGALKAELAEPPADTSVLATSFDPAMGQTLLSRPRTMLELVREAMLTENPVFSNGSPLWVARRDRRGMAVVALDGGKLPAPFVDANNDGLPDIDKLGRFVVAPDAKPPPDPFVGDDKSPIYEYIDARATGASALLRHVAPLADPDGGKESLVAALAAQEPLLREGGREALLDLVHAAGQAAADPGTDDLLGLAAKLFVEQPQLMARLTGSLLDIKATFDAHPEAVLPDGSTMIDDVLAVVVKIGREPGLLEEILGSMADDRSLFLPQALSALLSFNDRLTYDHSDAPNAINNTPKNLTTGGNEPTTLVDRSSPNTGWNRSLFQRFLQLIHDTNGVTVCNKDGAILHAMAQLPHPDGSPGLAWQDLPIPFGGTATECQLLRIEELSKFYLRAIIGEASIHFRNDFITPNLEPEVLFRSTGISGTYKTDPGQDLKPTPQFLNRLVFFDVQHDSVNKSADPLTDGFAKPNGRTNWTIGDLQGPFIPSSACAERSIPDPNLGDPDVHPDGQIHGLRTCQPGQSLYERDGDTLFALEFNHGYDALAPLTSVFVKHQKEDLLLELLEVLYKHWNVQGGVAKAEPALAESLKTDLIPALNKITKILIQTNVPRCAQTDCSATVQVPAGVVLADGLRAVIDPARMPASVTDRRGGTKTANGLPLTVFGMVRDAFNAEDTILINANSIDAWHAARSHIVDELLTVNGRGDQAAFADPGVAAMAPVLINLLRSQRLAKCRDDADCPQLRKQLAADVEDSLKSDIFGKSLDLIDVFLRDESARREIGRMLSYITRQGDALGGASVAPSSTPFATTNARSPGALDQTTAAMVDALGALGDLKEIRPFYPIISSALDHLDPQLALLSRLNARAFDDAGHELCSKELDPEEAIKNTLSRLTLSVEIPGQPKRSALQIILESMSDVNRVDASNLGPLDAADYENAFKNVHELLTDPTSGLEQLYASVKKATEH
jgi:hypothetical protein